MATAMKKRAPKSKRVGPPTKRQQAKINAEFRKDQVIACHELVGKLLKLSSKINATYSEFLWWLPDNPLGNNRPVKPKAKKRK